MFIGNTAYELSCRDTASFSEALGMTSCHTASRVLPIYLTLRTNLSSCGHSERSGSCVWTFFSMI
jgi:hypothetical protein